jgi:hypothetical protein
MVYYIRYIVGEGRIRHAAFRSTAYYVGLRPTETFFSWTLLDRYDSHLLAKQNL